MSAQQVQMAETIRAMKVALKRKADDSDSDTSIHALTNRGHKLQRNSRNVRANHLNTTGNCSYRQQINHAGYTRYTLSSNPQLYDADGDLYDPQISDDERQGSPIEDNPFGEVRLEELLRPLTAASELPDHPSLSVAYKSTALTQMVGEVAEMVRREQEVLWKAKRLLRRLRGDAEWVPCEVFETEQDEEALLPSNGDGPEEGLTSAVPSVDAAMEEEETALDFENAARVKSGEVDGDTLADEAVGKTNGGAMDGVEAMDMALQEADAEVVEMGEKVDQAGSATEGEDLGAESKPDDTATAHDPSHLQAEQNDDGEPSAPTSAALENPALAEIRQSIERDPQAVSSHTSNSGKDNAPSHSMTTRARARSPQPHTSPSPTLSDSSSIPPINPWYLVPSTSLPDRDLGLPAQEAEETRRLLLLYVQKQEQVVRSLTTLCTGLQRSDRLRSNIYRAAKAEGHVKPNPRTGVMETEMSDGEDWYDPEDWALGKGDLKLRKNAAGVEVLGLEKGKDEVEDLEEDSRRVGGRRRRVNRM